MQKIGVRFQGCNIKEGVNMFGIFEEICDTVSDAITTTAEAAAGVVVGTVEGVVKAPVVIAEKVIDEIGSLGDD